MGIPSIPKRETAAAPAPAAKTIPKREVAAPAAPVVETVEAAAPAAAPAEAPAAAPAPTAIATRPVNAVVVAGRPVDVVKENFKDAFTVDWNTLYRIQANNGNFLDVQANKTVIGPVVTLEMMSYQLNWQISPGTDDDADLEHVRYSNDGKSTTQGEDCNEYVQALKTAGYDAAKLSERCVLAGTIVGGSMDGKLVQINLAPTSKSQFDRFRMQVSVDVSRGRKTVDDARFLKMSCTPQSKGKISWTVVLFDYGQPA